MGFPGRQAEGSATTRQAGIAAEDRALAWLQARGLQLVARNYRTPGRGGGEIDLIMRDGNTLVFVEVRQRDSRAFGGAAASVGWNKRQRLVRAARHYLLRLRRLPPCRFDVISMERGAVEWIRAAFDAD